MNSAFSSPRVATAVPAGPVLVVAVVVVSGSVVISVRNWEVTVLKKRSILPLPWGR
ncbi:MAG: hypothetical protein ACR2HR_06335 [Euzebya sp.]